jgi:hypothetical protein
MTTISEKYEQMGREIAETEAYTNSEDAWEAEETHYALTSDEKEIAADAFGEGFISYTPAELSDVITAGEARELFGLAEATVRQAINRGQIPHRKSGGTWLILRKHAEARWGGNRRPQTLEELNGGLTGTDDDLLPFDDGMAD